ncbi:unnamed protein product [Gordionus sp. m RMFG-2023]|uniref:G-patch domain and KOW motifs-containing protein-like n=1 Tax=Gordionus sp. m RMFG-2023 TaxID=3053472 RepID=UPI0030DE676A
MSVIFKFNKKSAKLQESSIYEDLQQDESSKDYIKSLDNKKIKSLNPTKKKEYIIPLIKNDNILSTLEVEAINSLITESKEFKGVKNTSTDSNFMISLDKKIDQPFSLPNVSVVNPDYNVIPIEEYGQAILKGMGWKPGDPIGLRSKTVIAPITPMLRPKGLGLGAEKIISEQESKSHAKLRKIIESDDPHPPHSQGAEPEDNLDYSIGTHVVILKGSLYNDCYGKIEGIDEDNGRIIVKLAFHDDLAITIPKFLTKLITIKDFEKFLKKTNGQDIKSSEKDRIVSFINPVKQQYGLINMKEMPDKRTNHDAFKSSDDWVRLNLKVRIIDRKFKEGKYYKQKLIITKIIPPSMEDDLKLVTYTGIFISNDEGSNNDGKIVKDLTRKMLETVIPKNIHSDRNEALVMIVKGEYSGTVGQLIEKNSKQQMALVRIINKREKISAKEFSYNAVCEYCPD